MTEIRKWDNEPVGFSIDGKTGSGTLLNRIGTATWFILYSELVKGGRVSSKIELSEAMIHAIELVNGRLNLFFSQADQSSVDQQPA